MKAALLLPVALLGCATDPIPDEDLSSTTQLATAADSPLRVLSWNTFALPTIAGQMGQINMDEEARGRLVAKLLKASSYDVIALNEMFDEDVRDAFLEEAQTGSTPFRFIVEDIDGGGAEDSGLVLLSRLDAIRFRAPAPDSGQHEDDPLVPGTQLYADTGNCADMDVWLNGNDADSWVPGYNNCLVAFHRYRHCTAESPDGNILEEMVDPFLPMGAECDAGKGVAYVRLRQRNGKPLDVFWSHTQADLTTPEYDAPLPDFLAARDGQLAELEEMVDHWSPTIERDVVILGDLNVNGLNTSATEYKKQLATGASSRFGKLGFRDLWPEASTKEDLGASWSTRNDHVAGGAREHRLDYVLWRDRKGVVACDQRPKVLRHFDRSVGGGSTIDLSDHFGVGAELRPRDKDTEPCSPRVARKREELTDGNLMKGTLATYGACHWLRVEQGTWTVTNMKAEPLSISAYAVRDVSERLDFFRGDGELLHYKKDDEAQVAFEEPFLLEVCWQNPAVTGEYELKIAPNVGQDPAHPVVLPLNRDVKLAFGEQFGANPSTRIWTLAQLPRTISGAGHALRMDLGDHSSTKLRIGTAAVGAANPAITWRNSFTFDEGALGVGSHGGSGGELLVLVEREEPEDASEELSFDARVMTDHHLVKLGVLECVEQEDSTLDDHIRMTYRADGVSHNIVDLGDFDTGQDVNLSGHSKLGSNWVRGEVSITVYEQDGEDLEDDILSGDALDNLGSATIGDFSGDPLPSPEYVSDVKKFLQDDAKYHLQVSRQR